MALQNCPFFSGFCWSLLIPESSCGGEDPGSGGRHGVDQSRDCFYAWTIDLPA